MWGSSGARPSWQIRKLPCASLDSCRLNTLTPPRPGRPRGSGCSPRSGRWALWPRPRPPPGPPPRAPAPPSWRRSEEASATGADRGPPEQELKDALAERGLDTTGLKAVLVERLSAALAGGEDEPAAAAEEEPAEEPAAAPAEAAAEEEAGEEAPAAAEEPAALAPAEEASKEDGELEVQNGAIGDANIGGLGLGKSLAAMTEAEKMARRAARFGIIPKAAPKKPPPSAEKKPKKKKGGVDPELQKKLDARAARFGTGKKQGGPSSEELEKREARKARFEAPPLSAEMKAKMEARAAKFGGHTEQAMKRMGLPLGGEAKKQKA